MDRKSLKEYKAWRSAFYICGTNSFSMIIQRSLKLSLSAPAPTPPMGFFPAYDTPLSTPMLGFQLVSHKRSYDFD